MGYSTYGFDRPGYVASCRVELLLHSVPLSPNYIPEECAAHVRVPSLQGSLGLGARIIKGLASILPAAREATFQRKESRLALRSSAIPVHFLATNNSPTPPWPESESYRCTDSFAGHTFRRNGGQEAARPRDAPAKEEPSPGKHAIGSKDHCGKSPLQPSFSGLDELPR